MVSRNFLSISKQFTEPLKVVRNPTEFYTSKMGFLPRVIRTLVVGRDGLNRPVSGVDYGEGQESPYTQLIARIAATTGQFVPIPFQQVFDSEGNLEDPRTLALGIFGFPTSRENKRQFDRRKAIDLIEQQLGRGF